MLLDCLVEAPRPPGLARRQTRCTLMSDPGEVLPPLQARVRRRKRQLVDRLACRLQRAFIHQLGILPSNMERRAQRTVLVNERMLGPVANLRAEAAVIAHRPFHISGRP